MIKMIINTFTLFFVGLCVVTSSAAIAQIKPEDRQPTYHDVTQKKNEIADIKRQIWLEKQELRQLKKASLDLETDIKLMDSADSDNMRKAIENQLTTSQNVSKQFVLQSLSPLLVGPEKDIIAIPAVNALVEKARSDAILTTHDIALTYSILSQALRFKTGVVNVPQVDDKKIYSVGGLFYINARGQYLYEQGNIYVPLANTANQYERNLLKGFINAQTDYALLPLDIMDGKVFQSRATQPDLNKRFEQAGLVGKIIMAIGLFGLLVFLFRYLYLSFSMRKVKWQLKNMDKLKKTNAIGRILRHASDESLPLTTDTVELTVAPYMIAEIPRIEFMNSSLKLMASISPLLGLLGTVAGMVITFHGIALGGGADATVMAEGIERALMTTVFGLCVAIPLLVMHNIIASKANRLLSTIESETLNYLADKFINRQSSHG